MNMLSRTVCRDVFKNELLIYHTLVTIIRIFELMLCLSNVIKVNKFHVLEMVHRILGQDINNKIIIIIVNKKMWVFFVFFK